MKVARETKLNKMVETCKYSRHYMQEVVIFLEIRESMKVV